MLPLHKALRAEMFNQATGDRRGVPNVVIFVTDGVSNLNSERTIPETLLTHAAGIHVFVIGIGLTGETLEIKALSSAPVEENRFLVENFDQLQDIKKAMFTKMCESECSIFFYCCCSPLPPPYHRALAVLANDPRRASVKK